jgi:AbrB family looped-hinge helix DNA binding protein
LCLPRRIPARGQVTIPAAIRERAGLLPQTEVEVSLEGGVVILRPATPQAGGRGADILRRLRGRLRGGAEPMTTDEVMALTRGE